MKRLITWLTKPDASGDTPLGLAACVIVFVFSLGAILGMPGY